jgi:hypothetical protein
VDNGYYQEIGRDFELRRNKSTKLNGNAEAAQIAKLYRQRVWFVHD